MRKATVTYVAPLGDSKEVQMGGQTFRDGEAVELNTDEHALLISRLEKNQNFDFEMEPDDGKDKDGNDGEGKIVKRRPGRPTGEEKAARDAADKKLQDAKAAKEKAERDLNESQAEVDKGVARGSFKGTSSARVNLKDGIAEARDHDFEDDRRNMPGSLVQGSDK